jgi:glycosyltransferase involved in cell wall biosynthesis
MAKNPYQRPYYQRPYIDILLPYKEVFTPSNAGAVSTVVSDLAYHTTLEYEFHIYGRQITAPSFPELCYHALKPKWPFIYGHNLGLAHSYITDLQRRERQPLLIEVHGRCQVASTIAKITKTAKVALFLHNDPRQMTGSKTLAERLWLARNLAGIFANSNYIKNCFLDGFSNTEISQTPIFVTPLGANRNIQNKPSKEKTIIIASRIVPEKGILQAAIALRDILPDFPEWRVKIIGAKHFRDGTISDYEKSVKETLAPLQGQAEMAGFLPLAQINKELEKAAIAIVPSVWQEPASRAVLEALANGCALITTKRGGIPERAEGRALLVDNPDSPDFAAALNSLLSMPSKLKELHDIAWNDFPFDCATMAGQTDLARKNIIS